MAGGLGGGFHFAESSPERLGEISTQKRIHPGAEAQRHRRKQLVILVIQQ